MRRKSMPVLSVPGALVGGDEVTMAVFHEVSRAEGPSQQARRPVPLVYCNRLRQSSMNSSDAPHRRQFVRAALATAASYGRILGANDRVRIGAIGTGGRGQYLLSQLKLAEQNEIVACCDVYEPRRLEAKSK